MLVACNVNGFSSPVSFAASNRHTSAFSFARKYLALKVRPPASQS
jgi:hypothetical protein